MLRESCEVKSSKNWVAEGMDTEKIWVIDTTFSGAAPSPFVIFRLFLPNPLSSFPRHVLLE